MIESSEAFVRIFSVANRFGKFEEIARAIPGLDLPKSSSADDPHELYEPPQASLHPFDTRNVHPALPAKVKKLFDDGHFADATSTAFKFLDKYVQKHSRIRDSGHNLMMTAFNDANPKLQLTPLKTISEVDEQKGYRFIFAGSMWAIRNPRAHEDDLVDDPDTCLDHLCFVSMLIRRLEQSGYK